MELMKNFKSSGEKIFLETLENGEKQLRIGTQIILLNKVKQTQTKTRKVIAVNKSKIGYSDLGPLIYFTSG